MIEHKPSKIQFPAYFKYFVILSGVVLTGYILILGKSIINPLITALIIALLLRPLANLMERIHIPRAISSILSILLIFLVIGALSLFFSSQINRITNDLDSIGQNLTKLVDRAHARIEDTFGMEPQKQTEYLKDSLTNLAKNSSSFFGNTLSATAGFVSAFGLFIISLFFILYYRSFLVSFLFKLFDKKNHVPLHHTIHKIEGVVRSYVLGLFLVIVIIAILNTVGLIILGIDHAIFFGVLAAVLTIIPYIGIAIGSLLPILFALVTKDSLWYPVGVAAIFGFVQFLEGNFITPNVVGDRVSINPFAAILALFFGSMMLGITGTIFAIPLLAIIKVICQSIEPARPIAYIIGTPPEEPRQLNRARKRFNSWYKVGRKLRK